MYGDRELIAQKHILEKLRVTQNFAIPADELRELTVSTMMDVEFNRMKVELETYVAAEKLADEYFYGYESVAIPASTWQMFKHSNAHKWWMCRFAAKYGVRYDHKRVKVGVKVSRYLKYPELAIPRHRAVIHEMTERL